MARQNPKGKTARRATESLREESAKRAVPVRVPVREQRRAPHQQSRDKITMRSYWADGVAAVAEEESASPRQGDHGRHARNFRQSRLSRRLCTFEACGCPDALFPQDGLLRRESPRAHAQRGRARGGRASGCSVRRSGVQRSRAHVKGAICYRGRPCASARTTSRDAPAPRRHRSPRQLTSASSAWQRKRRWTR